MPELSADAPFVALLDEVRGMYPPDVDRLVFKASHDRVLAIAHGWYMRTLRTCDAVMLMGRSGFAEESWPLRRAALEHALALRWVAESGNEVVDVVVRVHGQASTKRQGAQSAAGWSTATWKIWAATAEDAEKATGNVSESHILTNLTARIERYGDPGDLAAWLIETTHSHPGWSTAVPYWDREGRTGLVAPSFNSSRLDAAFCSSTLLRSLEAVNRMLAIPMWDNRLRALGDRYQSLIDAIPQQTDPLA